MKKLISILLILTLTFALVACNGNKDDDKDNDQTNQNDNQNNNDGTNDGTNDDNGSNNDDSGATAEAMTYAEYMAANVDTAVVIEAYVQAHQDWWDNKVTVYLADKDGAYFAYEMACSEADAAKLTPGTKIKVSGYKSIWDGEIEIIDATFTFVEDADTYIAPTKDLTATLGTEELINYQNQHAVFTDLTIKSITYKNGEPGDDIYVTFTKDGKDYDFCVERYLTGPETDIYKAFATLKVGDVVDVEGFVYWYAAKVNTHITAIVNNNKSAGVMTYAEYMAANVDTAVVIEAYVQAHQDWWDNKVTVYLADKDGAYFAYEMACSEADAAKLTPGTKIKVSGYKSIWDGEIEIIDATFTFVENANTYVAIAKDITNSLTTESLIDYQNQLASFKNLKIKSITYKNGKPGDDIYVTVTAFGMDFDFCVERYLTGPETDVYKAFETLKVGDVVDVEGFVYWYASKINTHITKIDLIKPAGVMTYVEYIDANVDTAVVIEAYVQAHQDWWDNKVTVYLADRDGAYFVYEMACSEADAAKLTTGTKIKVSGYKSIWDGEIEIIDATFTFVENSNSYVASAKDLTDVLATEELISYQNQLAKFTGLTIKSITYKNGKPGDDIYVTFTLDGNDYDFCVERYLTGPETDVYKAFADLKAGDVVDVEGFVYWYASKVNTHITKVIKNAQ